jgi:hypothetical protein
MPELNFEQILILLIVSILGTIAIRFTFSFDLNRYLEERRKRYIPKLQNACTHIAFVTNDKGEGGFQSLYISPPGTLQWQCQQCRDVKYMNNGEFERQAEYYLKNPDEFLKQTKKFQKLLKKAGQI